MSIIESFFAKLKKKKYKAENLPVDNEKPTGTSNTRFGGWAIKEHKPVRSALLDVSRLPANKPIQSPLQQRNDEDGMGSMTTSLIVASVLLSDDSPSPSFDSSDSFSSGGGDFGGGGSSGGWD